MEKKLVSPNLSAAIHYEMRNTESLSGIMETFEIWSREDPILEARVWDLTRGRSLNNLSILSIILT